MNFNCSLNRRRTANTYILHKIANNDSLTGKKFHCRENAEELLLGRLTLTATALLHSLPVKVFIKYPSRRFQNSNYLVFYLFQAPQRN